MKQSESAPLPHPNFFMQVERRNRLVRIVSISHYFIVIGLVIAHHLNLTGLLTCTSFALVFLCFSFFSLSQAPLCPLCRNRTITQEPKEDSYCIRCGAQGGVSSSLSGNFCSKCNRSEVSGGGWSTLSRVGWYSILRHCASCGEQVGGLGLEVPRGKDVCRAWRWLQVKPSGPYSLSRVDAETRGESLDVVDPPIS